MSQKTYNRPLYRLCILAAVSLWLATCAYAAQAKDSVLLASSFPGADASVSINACEKSLPAGGGTCDARMFSGYQVMSQQISVLSTTTLLIPPAGVWTWDLRDGVSAGILQFTGSSIIGTAPGGGGSTMYLMPGSNATKMLALYATDGNPSGGGSYIHASGFAALNLSFPGASFSHGLIYTRLLFDESRIERIMAGNSYGDAWHIYGTCCDTEFVQVQASSHLGPLGGTPLVVENAVGGVGATFSWSGTVNAAGTGHPNIDFQAGNYGAEFPNLYTETGGPTADVTTAIVQVETNNANTPVLRFLGGSTDLNSSKPCFSIPTAYSPLRGFENHNWCNTYQTGTSVAGSLQTQINSAAGTVPTTDDTGQLTPSSASWMGLNGTAMSQAGQIAAGAVSFTPSVPGWYRVFSGGYLQGTVDIHANDPEQDTVAMIQQGWYNGPANITVLNSGFSYGGGSRIVTKLATSTLGGAFNEFLDIYVADVSSGPITLTFTGQGISRSGIQSNPALTTGPTEFSLAQVDLSAAISDPSFPAILSSGTIAAQRMSTVLMTPKSSSDDCAVGQSWDDTNYHYVCVARNVLKRVSLNSFE